MERDRIIELMEAWDRMDRAAQGVSTALPAQLTERVAELERARIAMRAVVQNVSRFSAVS